MLIIIVLIAVVVMLSISVWNDKQDAERLYPLLAAVYFFLASFTLNIGSIWLPLGFVLVLLYLSWKPRLNMRMKRKAAVFGLIYFLLVHLLPALSWSDIREQKEQKQLEQQFDRVLAVHHFERNAQIQTTLHQAVLAATSDSQLSNDPMGLFRIWVLQHKQIEIKPGDWLFYKAPQELQFYWSSTMNNDTKKALELITFGPEGYYGVFRKMDDGTYTLETVIEFEGLKQNASGGGLGLL